MTLYRQRTRWDYPTKEHLDDLRRLRSRAVAGGLALLLVGMAIGAALF